MLPMNDKNEPVEARKEPQGEVKGLKNIKSKGILNRCFLILN